MKPMDAITDKSMSYALSVVEEPEEHQDAVFATATDFSEGAKWMLERMCEFLQQDLKKVEVYSAKDDAEITAEKFVFVKDDTPAEFVQRFREAMVGKE